MRSGEHKVARDYVLYRDSRARSPRRTQAGCQADPDATCRSRRADGSRAPLDVERLRTVVSEACVEPQGRRRRAHHRRSAEQHVRRHLGERRRHVGVDHRAHAGRGRAELHLRHRPHPARRSARRSARIPRRSGARRHARRLPRHAVADARRLSGSAEGVHRTRRHARTRCRPSCASSISTRSARR